MREIKNCRTYVLWSVLLASIVLALIVHGPRLFAYIGSYSGLGHATQEGEYTVIPITIGQTSLHALVADTPEKRVTGLSYRSGLGERQAMIFVFDDLLPHGMWMKDMEFSIDIMWVDAHMRVIHIKKNVSPDTFPEVFEPESDSAFVIETAAGFVDKNHIKIGAELVLYW